MDTVIYVNNEKIDDKNINYSDGKHSIITSESHRSLYSALVRTIGVENRFYETKCAILLIGEKIFSLYYSSESKQFVVSKITA